MEALLPLSSISLLEDKLYHADGCVLANFLILDKVALLLLVIIPDKSKGAIGAAGAEAGEAGWVAGWAGNIGTSVS